jgi:oligoribonuclease (3'-5' exoribonuclease)
MLAKLWRGPAAMYPKPTDSEHDALFDIRQSVAELAHYRRTLFQGA